MHLQRWQVARQWVRRARGRGRLALALAAVLTATTAGAAEELDERALAEVQGAGLAIGLHNFSLRMAPTSFIDLTGTAPTAAAAALGWARGDLRLYGLSLTSASGGSDWYGNGCTGATALDCPIGGVIPTLASVYNPLLLRVFQYPGLSRTGSLLNQASGAATVRMPTVLELDWPSLTSTWRVASWLELLVNNGSLSGCPSGGNAFFCGAKLQLIMSGRPVSGSEHTYVRLFTMPDSVDPTLGITGRLAFSGNLRIGVGLSAPTTAAQQIHQVPDFSDREGLYFRNIDAFLPVGAGYYQALTFSSTASRNGNFVAELLRVPNIAAVYNDFYCGAPSCALNADGAIASPNPDTHGYLRLGTFSTAIPGNSTTNGVYFMDAAGSATNMGTARLEGITLHYLKFTTTGLQ